jgi:hypothetical protein
MKRFLSILAAAACTVTVLHSQNAAPVAPAAPLTPLQQLQAIRDANAKLIEAQAKTLQSLEQMDKEAQLIKIFAKRA